jgi:hypothetical protein
VTVERVEGMLAGEADARRPTVEMAQGAPD